MKVVDKRKTDQFIHVEDSGSFEYEGMIYMKLNKPYKLIFNNGAIKEVNAVNLENGELEYFSDETSIYLSTVEVGVK